MKILNVKYNDKLNTQWGVELRVEYINAYMHAVWTGVSVFIDQKLQERKEKGQDMHYLVIYNVSLLTKLELHHKGLS